MITSGDNERLKRIRKLGDRKWRERQRLFVTEGEDLLAAGLSAGCSPVDVLVAPGSEIDGIETEPDLLAGVSSLGSGTRAIAVWKIPTGVDPAGPAVYLDGVGDPGNVGTIVRTAVALTGAGVVLGPNCADAYSPKAVRASMGALFAVPPVRGDVAMTAEPRIGLVAHGGSAIDEALGELEAAPTLCLEGSGAGCPRASSPRVLRSRRFRCGATLNP